MAPTGYHRGEAETTGLRFTKLEGLGNDFIVVDERSRSEPSLSGAARVALCDRHRGVGADGVLTLLAPTTPGAVARMHVTNADGSEPEMCGNGIRCVAHWLVDAGAAAAGESFTIDTGGGPKRCRVVSGQGGLVEVKVEVEMGPARLHGAAAGDPLLRAPVEAGGQVFEGTAVSMGNPHLVLLEGLTDRATAERLGPILEHHPRFPARTNVGFARARAGGLDLVVWERGCGLTEACGTGACAAAVAYVEAGRAEAGIPLTVRLPGGDLAITVAADLTSVLMTGPARRVFAGVA